MKFVVTAGPTREPLDPVRFLSNRSSGKMGYALAAEAVAVGQEVTLISGPVSLSRPPTMQIVEVNTADEMFDAVHASLMGADVIVMCAAVADYKAAKVASQKIKKSAAEMSIALVATRDILCSLPPPPRDFLVVGFAAETNEVEARARAKLAEKNCDMLVANDVSDPALGMESEENAVTIFFRNGARQALTRAPKREIARELVKIILRQHQKSFDKKNLKMNDSKK